MATTTDTRNLTAGQKELVAVGASVGAGCHPCLSHHLKAGVNAGLGGEQLLAAVTSAERVTAEAAVLMADHARGKLDSGVATPAELSPLEEALAALGAALGANDASAIDLQMRTAHDFGATRAQLEQAIDTARTVQENAGRIHVREAQRLLDSITTSEPVAETNEESEGGCGCSSYDESEPAAQTQESVADATETQDEADATSSAATGSKPPVAECLGAAGNGGEAGPAAMIAHCRNMLGRMFGAPDAPAETKESYAATAHKGCSDIQEV